MSLTVHLHPLSTITQQSWRNFRRLTSSLYSHPWWSPKHSCPVQTVVGLLSTTVSSPRRKTSCVKAVPHHRSPLLHRLVFGTHWPVHCSSDYYPVHTVPSAVPQTIIGFTLARPLFHRLVSGTHCPVRCSSDYYPVHTVPSAVPQTIIRFRSLLSGVAPSAARLTLTSPSDAAGGCPCERGIAFRTGKHAGPVERGRSAAFCPRRQQEGVLRHDSR